MTPTEVVLGHLHHRFLRGVSVERVSEIILATGLSEQEVRDSLDQLERAYKVRRCDALDGDTRYYLYQPIPEIDCCDQSRRAKTEQEDTQC